MRQCSLDRTRAFTPPGMALAGGWRKLKFNGQPPQRNSLPTSIQLPIEIFIGSHEVTEAVVLR